MRIFAGILYFLAFFVQAANIFVAIRSHLYIGNQRYVYFIYGAAGFSALAYIILSIQNCLKSNKRCFYTILLLLVVTVQFGIAAVLGLVLEYINGSEFIGSGNQFFYSYGFSYGQRFGVKDHNYSKCYDI